jgi:hypothetical protein
MIENFNKTSKTKTNKMISPVKNQLLFKVTDDKSDGNSSQFTQSLIEPQ